MALGGLHAATGDDLVTDHEHEKVVLTQEPDNEPLLSSPDGQQSTINPTSLPTAGITNAISSSASAQEPCCAQATAALAPDPPSRRTPSPRRAASASRKRLQVIFEGEDEVDTGPPARLSRPMSTKMRGTTKARASSSATSSTISEKRKAKSVNTPQVSKATAGTRRRGATREARDIPLIHEADPEYVHDSDSSDDDSEWGVDLVEAGPDSAIASFQKPGLTDPRSFILDPSTCSACINGFKRPYDLARHIESYHQMKCMQCRVCGLSFSRKDALGRHEQRNRCKNRPTRKRRARKWELAASKEAAAEIDDETAAAFNFKAATDRLRWPHGR
ncbi:hypothetical protein DFH11DRAFT_1875954 [Phellopilus nigrolimitatus]|nr:hypothetical protein DFH11DRAFT_1875954 [Phellopilus nigrolimitatus]